MTAAVYSWKPHAQIPIDAQMAGEHLEMLREQVGGNLTPEHVVQDATHNNSPLHQAFEWDDSEAATRYRLEQAGKLIRSLVVTVKLDKRRKPAEMRAFVSITTDRKPKYTSLARAMGDKELRAQVVDRAWRELNSWRDRYQEYSELAKMIAAIDRVSGRRGKTRSAA